MLLFAADRARIRVIDGVQPLDAVQRDVVRAVTRLLVAHGRSAPVDQ